jgi:hypothetical protein
MFFFSIVTIVVKRWGDVVALSSEDDQRTFLSAGLASVCAHVNVYPKYVRTVGRDCAPTPPSRSHCRVYSLLYTFNRAHPLTSSFRGVNFEKVEELTVVNDHPLEHKVSRIILRRFPQLRRLRIYNTQPQEDKP